MTKTLPNSRAFTDKSRILPKFGVMIKRNSLKWMAVIAVFLSFFPSLWAGSSDSLLVKLNQTIEQRPSYMQRKEEALETLRQSLSKLSAGERGGAYEPLRGAVAGEPLIQYRLLTLLCYGTLPAGTAGGQ